MSSERLIYTADGLEMHGQLFVGEGPSPRPAILVFPEAFGLGEHVLSRAERLAALGYTALACDLHGERRVLTDMPGVMQEVGALMKVPSRIRDRAAGALHALLARAEVDADRIVAIGYCFGGTMALELARAGEAVAGVVGFHSGLSAPMQDEFSPIKARIQVMIGADDPGIPADQRLAFEEEMRRRGADWRMLLLGGTVHSFTNPAADALGRPEFAQYHPVSDQRSWKALRCFLDELFSLTAV